MTLAARNTTLTVGIVLTSMIAATALGAVGLGVAVGYDPVRIASFEASELFGYGLDGAVAGWMRLGISAVASMLAVVGGMLIRRYFRKSVVPGTFFFGCFVLLVAFEGLKPLHLVLNWLRAVQPYHVVLTRAVVFGHVAGAMSLLATSLYTAGSQYAKLWTVLGIVALVALAFAYLVPVDSGMVEPALIHPVGEMSGARFAGAVLAGLAVITFAQAALSGEQRSDGYRLLAAVLLVVGREILFQGRHPALVIAAPLMMVVGFALYFRRAYHTFLWSG